MSPSLRVGIIGCGVIAPSHIHSFRQFADVEVAWACDLVEQKACAIAERHGIAGISTDYREILDDASVDAISICTDHASHAPVAVDALEAGKHVLCEKALAANAEGLRQMLAAKQAHPELVFGGVFQHRIDAAIRYLKELVAAGAFGTMLSGSVSLRCLRTNDYYNADRWRGTWEQEGGSVLINQAIHYIDAIVWVMGGVRALSGTFANLTHGEAIETEDTAVASLVYHSGALGSLEATSSSHMHWHPSIRLSGSAGSLDLVGGKAQTVHFEDEALQREVSERFEAFETAKQEGPGKSYYGPSHPAQIADFVAAVREGREPFVTVGSAAHTVEVVLGIYQSQREGRRIDLLSSTE